ncbi:zinc finger protein 395 isoform X3 [Corvus moneduloides]|uniref:zinc finger protein 395 isoform X3 n=1 Tax=Corvus moneduloides TaxID=1196302 RepID=UPI0013635F7D|nr:zinc finger protein 395 isoform X3 [Corvus moneduloides]
MQLRRGWEFQDCPGNEVWRSRLRSTRVGRLGRAVAPLGNVAGGSWAPSADGFSFGLAHPDLSRRAPEPFPKMSCGVALLSPCRLPVPSRCLRSVSAMATVLSRRLGKRSLLGTRVAAPDGILAASQIPAPHEDGSCSRALEESGRAPAFPNPGLRQLRGQQVLLTALDEPSQGFPACWRVPDALQPPSLPDSMNPGPSEALQRSVSSSIDVPKRKADAAVEMDEMVAAMVLTSLSCSPAVRSPPGGDGGGLPPPRAACEAWKESGDVSDSGSSSSGRGSAGSAAPSPPRPSGTARSSPAADDGFDTDCEPFPRDEPAPRRRKGRSRLGAPQAGGGFLLHRGAAQGGAARRGARGQPRGQRRCHQPRVLLRPHRHPPGAGPAGARPVPARPEPLGARLLLAHPGRPRLPGEEPLPEPQRAPGAAAAAPAPAARGLPAPRLPQHQESPRRSQEMPQGLRHRAPGSVVHGLPLEKGLPALPGLRPAPILLSSHLEFPRESWNSHENPGIPHCCKQGPWRSLPAQPGGASGAA